MNGSIPHIDGATIRDLVRPSDAVQALREAIQDGLRPEHGRPRITQPLTAGELLLMPSESGSATGIKVITVAPGNPARSLPRIQGLYLLLDAQTLTPRCLIDGPALTDLRTPAVSIAATANLLGRLDEEVDIVFYGGGHQATGHLAALRDVLPNGGIRSATAVVRSPDRVDVNSFTDAVKWGTPEADKLTAAAQIIVCGTTARQPLFNNQLVRDDAIVIAVGSHEPDARELPSGLMARSDIVVEDTDTALRECGDIVIPVSEGDLDPSELIPMADLITSDRSVRGDRPVVFKSSGMSWEDLVVAEAVHKRFELSRAGMEPE